MASPHFSNARFLIIDDEPHNISVLTQMLQQWDATAIISSTDPLQTVPLFDSFQPDIVLLDLMMPNMDGFEVMQQLRSFIPANDFLPILILTADSSASAKVQALSLGATDFLTKPFDAVELSLRLHNLLDRRFAHVRLRDQNRTLDRQVQERTLQLAMAESDTADCLATAAEYRDDDTGRHTHRVGRMAAQLGAIMGLDYTETELLRRSAPLHDVGKIGIPDRILLKPGKLTTEEFDVMKTHTLIGHAIMVRHHTPLLQLAASIALHHHERFDGRGYPNGLAGDAIPLVGRIVAVADVFDALGHERPYKEAWPVERVIDEIQRQSGSQFDPAVVEAFSILVQQGCHSLLSDVVMPDAVMTDVVVSDVAMPDSVSGPNPPICSPESKFQAGHTITS